MKFTIFEKATGRIQKVLDMPPHMVTLQYDNDEQGCLEGAFPDDRYYIKFNTPVPIPPKPSKNHVFDYSTKTWVDPRTLDDLREEKWTEIKNHRTAVEFGNFTYNGMVFDGDRESQRRLMNLISVSKSAKAAGVPFETSFTLADNTVVTLSADDFIALELVKITQVSEAFAKAVQLRDQINSAGSAEEILSVTW